MLLNHRVCPRLRCSQTYSYFGSRALIAGSNSIIEFDHRLRSVPHALKMRLELRHRASVSDHDQIIVLRVLAARTEIRGACAEQLPVDRMSLEGFVRVTAGPLRMAQHAQTEAATRPRGRATRPTRRLVFVCKLRG